ncbi:MAG: Cys-tRNA(Pro) deacylase [Burkholderiales bacterium]|jgi:Cys-tRNA(Pro) deacylase|nr:Cys-tRNA(Pro) deacylase [Betaproteobacteria bacterium]
MSASRHVSETPATQWLRRQKLAFSEHPYDYLEHGGTAESARQLQVDEHQVVKTLVMQDEQKKPLIVLMHGDRKVSTKQLARQIGRKSIEPCDVEVAQRHSGYQVGGTSPFGLRKAMPIYVEASILDLPKIYINGGRRGFLLGLSPQVLSEVLLAKPVHCALADE